MWILEKENKSVIYVSFWLKTLSQKTCLVCFIACFLLMVCGQTAVAAEQTNLRILTVNVWSGLDYKGAMRMGEYETQERRDTRYQALLAQVKEVDPDVIFIQEANPVTKYSARLASDIGFDKIHQVCQAGIKFGPFGIPSNFKEGMSILTRPSLDLRKQNIWKLSGGFGIYGDAVTIHFDESIFAIVGKIIVRNTPVYLVNIHLAALPHKDSELANHFERLMEEKKVGKGEFEHAMQTWIKRVERQEKEMKKLIKHLSRLPENSPVIVAGDFNAVPDSNTIQLFQSAGFFDVYPLGNPNRPYSWDPADNQNIIYSSRGTNAKGVLLQGYDLLSSMGAKQPRRVDYVFLSSHFKPGCVKRSRIVLDSFIEKVQASDHFGVLAEISLDDVIETSAKEFKTVTPLPKAKFEFLPILMYDTNVGFGYGGKFFYLNPLKLNESFDLVVFNSTKGIRWYRLMFSLPDFELRQGKIYPLALDLLIDFDKWINRPFFGLGNDSKYKDEEIYTREPLEIRFSLSKGFSPYLVGQVGASYKTIRNYNFEEDSLLEDLEPELNRGRVKVTSLFANFRYDTRNSFINPSSGVVLQGEVEFAPKLGFTNVNFTRLTFWFQHYYELFYPKTVLALRMGFQSLIDGELPVQVLLPMGGSNSLRGYPQDRFLGKVNALFNAELRFPVFWRLGGVVGFDAGRVWNSLKEFKVCFNDWATNINVGLRFYMDTFVVRMDIGFSNETSGFFFNFGHVF